MKKTYSIFTVLMIFSFIVSALPTPIPFVNAASYADGRLTVSGYKPEKCNATVLRTSKFARNHNFSVTFLCRGKSYVNKPFEKSIRVAIPAGSKIYVNKVFYLIAP